MKQDMKQLKDKFGKSEISRTKQEKQDENKQPGKIGKVRNWFNENFSKIIVAGGLGVVGVLGYNYLRDESGLSDINVRENVAKAPLAMQVKLEPTENIRHNGKVIYFPGSDFPESRLALKEAGLQPDRKAVIYEPKTDLMSFAYFTLLPSDVQAKLDAPRIAGREFEPGSGELRFVWNDTPVLVRLDNVDDRRALVWKGDKVESYESELKAKLDRAVKEQARDWIIAPGEITSLKHGKLEREGKSGYDVYVVDYDAGEAILINPGLEKKIELVDIEKPEERKTGRLVFTDPDNRKVRHDFVVNADGSIDCPYVKKVEELSDGRKRVEMEISGEGGNWYDSFTSFVHSEGGVGTVIYLGESANISHNPYLGFITKQIPKDIEVINEISLNLFINKPLSVDNCLVLQIETNADITLNEGVLNNPKIRTVYNQSDEWCQSVGEKHIDLTLDKYELPTRLGDDWFVVRMFTTGTFAEFATISSFETENGPKLIVDYTVKPGQPIFNTSNEVRHFMSAMPIGDRNKDGRTDYMNEAVGLIYQSNEKGFDVFHSASGVGLENMIELAEVENGNSNSQYQIIIDGNKVKFLNNSYKDNIEGEAAREMNETADCTIFGSGRIRSLYNVDDYLALEERNSASADSLFYIVPKTHLQGNKIDCEAWRGVKRIIRAENSGVLAYCTEFDKLLDLSTPYTCVLGVDDIEKIEKEKPTKIGEIKHSTGVDAKAAHIPPLLATDFRCEDVNGYHVFHRGKYKLYKDEKTWRKHNPF